MQEFQENVLVYNEYLTFLFSFDIYREAVFGGKDKSRGKQLRGFLFLHSRFLRRHHTRRLESLRVGTAPYLIHSSERENRQRDITPDTPHWSIGRELGSLSPTRIPTRKNRLERYRLVFMGRFRPHTPGLFSARYGLTTCNEYGETRSRTDRASPRTLAG